MYNVGDRIDIIGGYFDILEVHPKGYLIHEYNYQDKTYAAPYMLTEAEIQSESSLYKSYRRTHRKGDM